MPKTCAECGAPLPPRQLVYCGTRCGKTAAARTAREKARAMFGSPDRQRMADLRAALGWKEVESAPDRRPAVALRQELARDRLQGYPFDLIWGDEVDSVVYAFEQRGVLSHSEAASWREVFRSTESAWRAAYERSEPSVSLLSVEMLPAA